MSKFSQNVLQKVKNAPVDPGCYLFKNDQSKIIYIGKAKNLRNRVKSYFVSINTKEAKTQSLVRHIRDIEFIITHSEVEALILENTLIKEHKPRYNIFLRDDKTFPYVRITKEHFPRIFLTRKLVADGSKYFGPYTDSRAIRDIVRIIKKVFTVRNCNYRLDHDTVNSGRVKLCLQYHIHNCEAPCQKLISESDYNTMVSKVESFLRGNSVDIIEFLTEKMQRASGKFQFEIAARYRDNIKLLTHYFQKQSVELPDFKNRDFINLYVEEDIAVVIVIRVRQGKMLGKDTVFIEGAENADESDVMRTLIQQYYDHSQLIPEEIDVNIYPSEQPTLEKWLSEMRQKKVHITRPAKEEKLRLMRLAEKNAKVQVQEYILKKSKTVDYVPKSLKQLQIDLNLESLPKRIEAFDISNIQGKYAVGSLVTFINARPQKSEYRRFRIKTVKGINDFAMLEEVVQRRYSRQLEEKHKLPDIILIDGGKGQLASAVAVLHKLSIEEIPIFGIAKKLEEIFIPSQPEPVLLPRNSVSLTLLQRIRDEAHRFAITYHRNIRGKGELDSVLDHIPGLGNKKKQALWSYFSTIKNMRSASIDELCKVEGIGQTLAKNIWDFLHHG